MGLSALRERAARGGWRRADQVWTPPNRLDPQDEGIALEQEVDGDLDRIEPENLAFVAHRRMMRAALRGDAAEALRWRRVQQTVMEEAAETQRFLAQDALFAARHQSAKGPVNGPADPDGPDSSDASHGVFAVRTDRPA